MELKGSIELFRKQIYLLKNKFSISFKIFRKFWGGRGAKNVLIIVKTIAFLNMFKNDEKIYRYYT